MKNSFLNSILFSCVLIFPALGHAQISPNPPDRSIAAYLMSAGKKFNIWFTVESAYRGPVHYQELTTSASSIPAFLSTTSFVEEIPNILPGYVARIDPENPNVIHIIDRSLLSNHKYYMDHVLDKVSFNGNIVDYVSYLDSGQKRLLFDSNRITGEGPIIIDFNLKVKVANQNITVRQALSNCFPKNYSRFLWVSTTDINTNSTLIKIPGSNFDWTPEANEGRAK